MNRNSQVSRILAIIDRIQKSRVGVTIAELAREFDVSPKTIRRDLAAMEQAGFPLFDEDHAGKPHFKFVDGFMKFEVPFNAAELMCLYFLRDFTKPLEGTGFDKPFKELMSKVASHLPDEAKIFCHGLEKSYATRVGPHVSYKNHRALIGTLTEAVRKQFTVVIQYGSLSSRRVTQRELNPYALVYFDGAFYVLGLDGLSGEMRTFNIERIKVCTPTQKKFVRPKDFAAEEYYKDSYGIFKQNPVRVRIAFDADVAPFIRERQWHHTQKISDQTDGSLVLTLNVSGTREIKAWIMGFCEHATVLEPQILREEIVQDLLKTVKKYDGSKSSTKIRSANRGQ